MGQRLQYRCDTCKEDAIKNEVMFSVAVESPVTGRRDYKTHCFACVKDDPLILREYLHEKLTDQTRIIFEVAVQK